MNNMHVGVDANARFLLDSLKENCSTGKITGADTLVIDGVYFSNDPEAQVLGEFEASTEDMLSFHMKPMNSKPRWQALRFNLGAVDLSHATVFGVVIKSSAPASTTTRLCLRAENGADFFDTPFSKTLVSFAESSVHLDAIEIDKAPDLPLRSQRLDLIFFFRNDEVNISLQDIRLFVL